MHNQARWRVEKEVMRHHFPSFMPFLSPSGWLGFFGDLKGPRTGRRYRITIKARMDEYPQKEPATYIEPRPEPNHWIVGSFDEMKHRGKLCYQRDQNVWLPARSTFANCLLIAIKYLAEFDR